MSFEKLILDRKLLQPTITEFCNNKSYRLEIPHDTDVKKLRCIITCVGQESAIIDCHLRNDGTTTIQYKIGKNQQLGLEIAEFIKNKLCTEEISSLNLAISGICQEDFGVVLEEITNNSENEEIVIDTSNISGGTLYKLHSKLYSDNLNLSFYPNVKKLLIQGKPLSCYKVVAYALALILDTDTLGRILYKKDDADAIIVRTEMAEDSLKEKLPNSFNQLPDILKKLLISSYCIKCASPKLLDYSMLTYAELRSLEGIIKENLSQNGLSPLPEFIGTLFEKDGSITGQVKFILKQDTASQFSGSNQSAIENAYSYYKAKRHALFHMDEIVEASSRIKSLQEANNICNKIYQLIEDIYK